MARYTKNINLIAKEFTGSIVTDNIFTINQNARKRLDWEDPLWGKKVISLSVNLYALKTATAEIDPSLIATEKLVTIRPGWNSIDFTPDHKQGRHDGKIYIASPFDGTRIEIYSHVSSYKPYIIVTYEDVAPGKPTSLHPANTTLNTKENIRFSWRHNSNEGTYQKGFTLQYSVNGGSTWTTVTRTTTNQFYDMPANTLPISGDITWRIKTTDANDLEGDYSNTSTFTATATPNAPTNLHPANTSSNPRNVIRFSWKHNSVVGLTQKGFILQYSIDSGSNWTSVNQTTSNQYYDLPANTFKSNTPVIWKVRTIDGNDLTSADSVVSSFVLKIPPSPPSNLMPRDTEVNIEEVIRFSWKHNSNEGYFQKGFILQYSTDNQATWSKVTRTTSNQYYDLPANTFKSSTPVLWKVQTVDGNDEVSEYTTATFSGRVPPSAPINLSPKDISLNPSNIIRFSWKHNSKDGITQKGFTLEYSRDNDGNWTTINKTTSDEFYDMPAKTFPKKGSIAWRIRTTDTNGLTSKNSEAQFTLKTPPDDPTSLYPNNITLNPREVIKFSWLHNSNSDLGQKDFTLQYSVNGGSTWTTVTRTTSNQFYDMPANTLPTTGIVIWRVKTTDGNGDSSNFKGAGFTLGTPPQQAPLPIQPVGAYLDSTEPIVFEWHFMGGTPGETQTKFELQYSINSGSTWTTITETTSRTSRTLPANTFNLTGNITWRVRTYNNFDEVSPYSEHKTFYVISSPPIPQILDISNNARPVVKWTSQGQHIYEIQILQEGEVIFKSGAIPSVADREYKLQDYLKDGNYTAKIRVTNEYNLYSPWAEKSFTISTVKPPKPIIAIYNGEYTVTINTNITSLKSLVYRDNIAIGEMVDGNFIDYTGENNKEYKYFVRSINEDDNFHDSDVKLSKCSFKHNTIATLENPDKFIKLKYGLGGPPKKSNTVGTIGGLNYYDGRKYPISEYGEFKQFDKSLTFTVRTKEQVDNLARLINQNKTLIYRDCDGENIKGTVFSLNYDKGMFGYEVGFTISRTEV